MVLDYHRTQLVVKVEAVDLAEAADPMDNLFTVVVVVTTVVDMVVHNLKEPQEVLVTVLSE